MENQLIKNNDEGRRKNEDNLVINDILVGS